jgi:hypothetical protein
MIRCPHCGKLINTDKEKTFGDFLEDLLDSEWYPVSLPKETGEYLRCDRCNTITKEGVIRKEPLLRGEPLLVSTPKYHCYCKACARHLGVKAC